jgi:hypothetical protein
VYAAAVAMLFALAPPARATSASVAHWTMDEGAGVTVADSVGSANGTLTGAASWLASGAAIGSSAVSFAGSTGHVAVPGSAALEPTELTLSAWVRGDPANPPAFDSAVVEKGAFGCAGPSYGLYAGAYTITFKYNSQVGGPQTRLFNWSLAIPNLWDGRWHLIAASIQSGGKRVLIGVDGYVNDTGTWLPTETNPISYAGATDSSLSIGAPVAPTCHEPAFSGDIDDVRLYDSAAAFDTYVDQMPPVPTSLSMTAPETLYSGRLGTIPGTITPRPRDGQYWANLYVAGTRTLVTTFGGGVDVDGHVIFWNYMPPKGTYDVDASYVPVAPYLASQASTQIVVMGNPSSTTFSMNPPSPTVREPVSLIATVAADPSVPGLPAPEGKVDFVDTGSGAPVVLGSASIADSRIGKAQLSLPSGLGLGEHHIVAHYVGDDTYATSDSDPLTLGIGQGSSSIFLSGPTTAQTHHPVVFGAQVAAPAGWTQGATVTFSETGVATPLCTIAPKESEPARCSLASMSVGSHVIRATYSGNAESSGAQSDPLTVQITTDIVDATGVGLAWTTFYPYKDGYRDTLAIQGTRREPISVAVRVYSPTGKTVKSMSVARASGTYSLSWNGRTSSGTMLTAGKYKVVQTLIDASGTVKKVTNYVNLSRKHLYYTTAYLTKLGSSYSSKGTGGSGKVVTSTSGGYVKLVAPGSYNQNQAAVGYQFTLPSATVYKSLRFQVYAQGGLYTAPNEIKLQNFARCPLTTGAWNESCFDHAGSLGASTSGKSWRSTSGSPTSNRSGRIVRGAASILAGTYYIYKARIVVTYGVLR